LKKFHLKFSVLVIQLSILQFILFFSSFLGLQTAFDYPMGDYTRFCIILGIKQGFLKFFDFRKNRACFFRKQQNNFSH